MGFPITAVPTLAGAYRSSRFRRGWGRNPTATAFVVLKKGTQVKHFKIAAMSHII